MEFLDTYGIGLIIVGLSFALFIYAIHSHRVQRKIKRDGFAVTADVTDKSSSFGGRTTAYKFYLSYVYEGTQYECKVGVTVEEYGNYPVGSQMPVFLLPDKPKKCYTESFMEASTPIGMYVASALVFACGLIEMLFSAVAE